MSPTTSLVWAVIAVLAAGALSVSGAAVAGRGPWPGLVKQQALVAPVLAVGAFLLLSALDLPEPAWRGDGATGDLGQWTEAQAVGPEAVSLVDAPVREGFARSLRFEVEPGDRTFGQTEEERAELMASPESSGSSEGEEQWYAWSTLLPEPVTVGEQGFLSITQWHQSGGSCPPNIALLVAEGAEGAAGDPERLVASVRGGDLDVGACSAQQQETFDPGPLPVGTWTDFLVHVRWSADPEEGLLEVRRDGDVVLAPTRLATLYTGQHAYLKQGVYRSNTQEPVVLYVAGTRRDEREAGVDQLDCPAPSWRQSLLRREAWC